MRSSLNGFTARSSDGLSWTTMAPYDPAVASNLSFPLVLTSFAMETDGNVVHIVSEYANVSGGSSTYIVSRSTDGLTWTSQTLVEGPSMIPADPPSIAVNKVGVWVITFTCADRLGRQCVSTSTNGGASWSTITALVCHWLFRVRKLIC